MTSIKKEISIPENQQPAIYFYLEIAPYPGVPDCSEQSHYLAAKLNI